MTCLFNINTHKIIKLGLIQNYIINKRVKINDTVNNWIGFEFKNFDRSNLFMTQLNI